MRTYLFLSVALLVLVGSSVGAQEPITLNLQLFQDEALIASPAVKVRNGETGSVTLPDVFNFTFTPTRLENDRISISFEIQDGPRTITPRVLISQDEPGSLKWTPANSADETATVEIQVAVGRG
jgi:hypothetical protein